MLYQPFISKLLRLMCVDDFMPRCLHPFVWIDTNLTIAPTPELVDSIRFYQAHWGIDSIGVCGCFKPEVVDLEFQLRVAAQWLEPNTPMYWYWPGYSMDVNGMVQVMEGLDATKRETPLRLTVLNWSFDYVGGEGVKPQYNTDYYLIAEFMRSVWRDWCSKRYPKNKLWLPSNQVAL